VLAPPAEVPQIVTLFGLPPKAAMLFLTQHRAADWSFSPMLPGTMSSPVLRKPVNQISGAG